MYASAFLAKYVPPPVNFLKATPFSTTSDSVDVSVIASKPAAAISFSASLFFAFSNASSSSFFAFNAFAGTSAPESNIFSVIFSTLANAAKASNSCLSRRLSTSSP